MGQGIAQVAVVAGHPVLLHDIDSAAADKALAAIRGRLDRLVEKGRLTAADRDAAAARMAVAPTLESMAPARLVIEAVVERLDIKQQVFKTLEDACGNDVILASNTSSLSITAIASALKRPERMAGMHFFNPAPLMRLVEIVSGLPPIARWRRRCMIPLPRGASRRYMPNRHPVSSSTALHAPSMPKHCAC